MKYLYSIIVLSFFILSCQSKEKTTRAETAYNEAMTVHDEVMPRMDEIHKLKKELTLQLEKVESEEEIGKIKRAISNLEKADHGMMDWMHNVIKYPDESSKEESHAGHDHGMHNTDTSLSIHQEQKEAILKVKSDMENAIDQAKKLVH